MEVALTDLCGHQINPHATQPHTRAPGIISPDDTDDTAIVLHCMTPLGSALLGQVLHRHYCELTDKRFYF